MGVLYFRLAVPRGDGNPHFQSKKKVFCSVAEGPVSCKVAYLPPVMVDSLIQDCGISLLRFCNEYLQKFNPPLRLDFENGSRNRFKIQGNIILKVQIL